MNLPTLEECKSRLFVVSFSGGKDSVATWLHLEKELGLRVQAVFADTGHEAATTYEYLRLLERDYGLPLVTVTPKVRDIWEKPPARIPAGELDSPLNMAKLIEIKRRAPSATARFCTTTLKLRPLRNYIRTIREPIVMACGVRAQESKKRSCMSPWAMDDFMGVPKWLPIHDWTHEEVFACHKRHGIPPNPLYLQGHARVGCWPCIFARKAEMARFAEDEAAVAAVRGMEANGSSFFAHNKTPKRFHSAVDPKSGKSINKIDDVIRWATEGDPAAGQNLKNPACGNVYGLCV